MAAIESLFDGLAEDGPAAEAQLKSLHRAFHEAMARALEPRVNAFLARREPRSLAEYRHDASHVDALISALGVTATADGKPALLVGELSHRHAPPNLARYAVVVPLRGDRVRYAGAFATAQPLHLNLVPLTPEAAEALARLRTRFEPERGR